MNNPKEHLKYYFLEDYLFNDVSQKFHHRGYLEPKEFFAIVIWKSNRAKTRVLKGIKNSKKTVRTITEEIFKASTRQEKLKLLTDIYGIAIPMASAILAVCYPDQYTIADYRAKAALKVLGEELLGDLTAQDSAYFEYVDKAKVLAKKHGVSLRDFDRILWGKDFYEGENGLQKLVEGLA